MQQRAKNFIVVS